MPVETLEVPRNTWFRRLAPKADRIMLLWLPGGGKIAYFDETEEFFYWSIDGPPKLDLVPLDGMLARQLTSRLRRALFNVA